MRRAKTLYLLPAVLLLSGCGQGDTQTASRGTQAAPPVADQPTIEPAPAQPPAASPPQPDQGIPLLPPDQPAIPSTTPPSTEPPAEQPSIPSTTPPTTTPPTTTPPVEAAPGPASGNEDPQMALINAIRQRPWDEQSLLNFAAWLESRDKPRAELVRVQAALAKLAYQDPQRAELGRQESRLLAENRQRWLAPLASLGEAADEASIQFGLIDELELDGATDEQLACLKLVPELRKLSLTSPKITDAGFALIAGLPNLDYLMIEGGTITESNLAQLEKLPPWTAIRLYVDELDYDRLDAMNERRIGKFQQLAPEGKQSAAARYLNALGYRTSLGAPPAEADLGQSGIRDPEMLLLSGATQLEKIYISESDITTRGVAHLAGLTKLKDLGLWDTKVASIAPLAKLTNLEKLGIYPEFDTEMGDEGTAVLENFVKLEDLYLSDEGISDATVKRLAPLTRLRKLELSVGGLEDENSLAALAGLTRLENLSFDGAEISDAVLEHLAGMTNLETLSLRIGRGTGEGFQHLAGLGKLKYLYLSGDGVTDKGLGQLAGLAGLQSIMAQGSAVTQAGAERLAARLPHVTIVLDEQVVKTPREAYAFRRQRFNQTVSVLLPADWTSDERVSEGYVWVREDGWEKIGGWSGKFVGPGEIHMYDDDDSASAEEAMMASVNNNKHLNPKVLKRDVQAFAGAKQMASCIYQDDYTKYYVGAARTGDGIVVLTCQAPPSRFAGFEPLFLAVAHSVHISDDAAQHKEETVEIPADKLKPK